MNAIEVNGLTKYYGQLLAVDRISFAVRWSEIFGLLGPNGAGKTTTVRMLCGLTRISGGEAYIAGKSVKKEGRKIKYEIGVVPDISNMYSDLTAMDNLIFCGEMYGIPRKERKKRARELLEFFGLREKANSKFRFLSKGQKRKLTIAAALIHKPRILFLDEPTIGLDVRGRRAMWHLIRRINKREGVTIFLTTHNIYEAFHLCDTIAIINKGRIVEMGKPEELREKFSSSEVIEVCVSPLPKELKIDGVSRIERKGNILVLYSQDLSAVLESLSRLARTAEISLLSLRGSDAEEIFLRIVGDENA